MILVLIVAQPTVGNTAGIASRRRTIIIKIERTTASGFNQKEFIIYPFPLVYSHDSPVPLTVCLFFFW